MPTLRFLSPILRVYSQHPQNKIQLLARAYEFLHYLSLPISAISCPAPHHLFSLIPCQNNLYLLFQTHKVISTSGLLHLLFSLHTVLFHQSHDSPPHFTHIFQRYFAPSLSILHAAFGFSRSSTNTLHIVLFIIYLPLSIISIWVGLCYFCFQWHWLSTT